MTRNNASYTDFEFSSDVVAPGESIDEIGKGHAAEHELKDIESACQGGAITTTSSENKDLSLICQTLYASATAESGKTRLDSPNTSGSSVNSLCSSYSSGAGGHADAALPAGPDIQDPVLLAAMQRIAKSTAQTVQNTAAAVLPRDSIYQAYSSQTPPLYHAQNQAPNMLMASRVAPILAKRAATVDEENLRLAPNKLQDMVVCTNQMGGSYSNGKPLPLVMRQRIIMMANRGFKASEISKQLKVSHGCISKIINKFLTTGSIMPGVIGGSKPKVATEKVVNAIAKIKENMPCMFAWEIKEKLVESKICSESNAPSVSSINRIIRQQQQQIVSPSNVDPSKNSCRQFYRPALNAACSTSSNLMLGANKYEEINPNLAVCAPRNLQKPSENSMSANSELSSVSFGNTPNYFAHNNNNNVNSNNSYVGSNVHNFDNGQHQLMLQRGNQNASNVMMTMMNGNNTNNYNLYRTPLGTTSSRGNPTENNFEKFLPFDQRINSNILHRSYASSNQLTANYLNQNSFAAADPTPITGSNQQADTNATALLGAHQRINQKYTTNSLSPATSSAGDINGTLCLNISYPSCASMSSSSNAFTAQLANRNQNSLFGPPAAAAVGEEATSGNKELLHQLTNKLMHDNDATNSRLVSPKLSASPILQQTFSASVPFVLKANLQMTSSAEGMKNLFEPESIGGFGVGNNEK